MLSAAKKLNKKSGAKLWSSKATRTCNAMDLEDIIFTSNDSKRS